MKQCKKCNVIKPKVDSGRQNNVGKTIFVDAEGKRWNGAQCPQCTTKVNNIRALRNKKLKTQANKKLKALVKARYCSRCNRRLPKTRYFNHAECIAHIETAFIT